ncbi:hypothetical protein [Undibacterium sp. Ren11W]|uniref:hypothetical protein n=1 Tax=Undibacterium sp. Ren11W TaxID=3413045 RepID=UPI003BF14BFA
MLIDSLAQVSPAAIQVPYPNSLNIKSRFSTCDKLSVFDQCTLVGNGSAYIVKWIRLTRQMSCALFPSAPLFSRIWPTLFSLGSTDIYDTDVSCRDVELPAVELIVEFFEQHFPEIGETINHASFAFLVTGQSVRTMTVMQSFEHYQWRPGYLSSGFTVNSIQWYMQINESGEGFVLYN